jgi:hypothetical protein
MSGGITRLLFLVVFSMVALISNAQAQTSITVTSNPLWTDTGIVLASGDQVSIAASGSWSWNSSTFVGPEGAGAQGLDSDEFEHFDGSSHGRLIGFIGPDPCQGRCGDGTFFPQPSGYISVGTGTTFTASTSGKLWLGFNDDAVSGATYDNSGSVTAVISVSPVLTTATIKVTTNLDAATFTLSGPATYTGNGKSFTITSAPAGTYSLTYGSVAKYVTPPSQKLTLSPGQILNFPEGDYAPITLRVCPIVSPTCAQSVRFSYQKGKAGLIPSQQLAISSNAPVIPFATTVSSIPAGWLSISPTNGNTPGTLVVTITPINDLSPGTYTGQVSVSSPASFTGPQSVAVELTVLAGGSTNSDPCLIFVHGSRESDAAVGYDWSLDWLAGRDYWRSYVKASDVVLGGPNETLLSGDPQDFIFTATGKNRFSHFVVRYNGAAPWWNAEAAGQVATEIIRATNGEFDGPAFNRPWRSRCAVTASEGGTFWVITHSMGATVMDYILGNARPIDHYYNDNGPYDSVAARISGVISVGGGHRGSRLADFACNRELRQAFCPLDPAILGACTPARLWLQTDEAHQVSNYAGPPAKPVWLIGGYKSLPPFDELCLPGEHDGVVQYASQFACKDNPLAHYTNKNVCSNDQKQAANFYNLDAVYENHDNERNNQRTVVQRLFFDRERTAITDGIWTCNGRPCEPGQKVKQDQSTADFIYLLLSSGTLH